MSVLFSLCFSFALLLFSASQGYFIAYPLLLSLLLLLVAFSSQGFSIRALITLGVASSQKAFSVVIILLMIGAVTAVWMAAGTIPALVYYGIKLVNPQYFIISAFVLTSLISVVLGTSFGTVGTVGVALMIMAKSGDIDPHIVAGAIIAGAYFGDRCSPMSSSANLVASLTKTKLDKNLRVMMATAWLPLITSISIYLLLSLKHPVQIKESSFLKELVDLFEINLVILLPVAVLIILCVYQLEVKLTLLLSFISGLLLGMFYQSYSFFEIIKFTLFGFHLESRLALSEALTEGGIMPMFKVSIVVILSTFLAGIIVGTKTLAPINRFLTKASKRSSLFFATTTIALVAAAFGCTQTLAILMTQQLVREKYEREQLDRYQLASDIENTAVVLSPLIPWNIAGLVPATMLMTDSGFIPYAVYLYLIPLFNFAYFKLVELQK